MAETESTVVPFEPTRKNDKATIRGYVFADRLLQLYCPVLPMAGFVLGEEPCGYKFAPGWDDARIALETNKHLNRNPLTATHVETIRVHTDRRVIALKTVLTRGFVTLEDLLAERNVSAETVEELPFISEDEVKARMQQHLDALLKHHRVAPKGGKTS